MERDCSRRLPGGKREDKSVFGCFGGNASRIGLLDWSEFGAIGGLKECEKVAQFGGTEDKPVAPVLLSIGPEHEF